MHTLRLKLKTTQTDERIFEKRFHALSHVHNVMVKHAKKLLNALSHDQTYQDLKKQYLELAQKEKLTTEERKQKKQLSDEMKRIRKDMKLTEADFQSYLKVCGSRFSHCLSSQQVQKEASRVWKGVEKVLFGNGKEIHFKKYMDFDTISGKSNTNGAKFDPENMVVNWIGLSIPCKRPKKPSEIEYVSESLNHKISYCEIQRKMFPNGWHYYALVYLDGDAPVKHKSSAAAKDNCMGIDPGVSTIAGVSNTQAVLEELAPKCKTYNKKIKKLQEKMDRSKRTLNPEKYNEDGTLKKGQRGKWKYSNTYRKDRCRLKSLFRQKAAYIKQSHEQLANRLLEDSLNFIVEDMSYQALMKKAKKTERQEKRSEMEQKDGTIKIVHKYKRKKRFGHSLNNRAPAMFLTILERKAQMRGGFFVKIHTKTYKASQYDHTTDSYTKIPLSQRSKTIGGYEVQRDLYSAFLISNSDSSYKHPDKTKCDSKFDSFLNMQDRCMEAMKKQNITMKQCFGF